jgi:hypothetical protein
LLNFCAEFDMCFFHTLGHLEYTAWHKNCCLFTMITSN